MMDPREQDPAYPAEPGPGVAAGDVRTPRERRRAVRASLIGTVLEFYDLGIYATMASTVFASVFFASGSSPALGAVQAIATFSVAYVVRPFAGMLLGSLGDRFGRKRILIFCLVVMGVSTMGIGLIPTYASIGWAATALLILMRLGQGIGASAELSGASLVAVEFAPQGRRGLFGSIAGLGAAVGSLVATVVVLVLTASMSEEQFLSWGWRIPFLLSTVLIVYGLYLRVGLPETPQFREIQRAGATVQSPLREVVRRWPRAIVAIVCVCIINAGFAFFMQVFMVSYATGQLGYERSEVLAVLLAAQVTMIMFIPVFGLLADRLGARRIIGWAAVATIAFALVLFRLVRADQLIGTLIAFVVGAGFITAAIVGPLGVFTTRLLPAGLRYSGSATGRELGTVVGSGLVPLLAAQLVLVGGGSTLPLVILLVAVGAFGVVGALLGREAPAEDPDAVVGTPVTTTGNASS